MLQLTLVELDEPDLAFAASERSKARALAVAVGKGARNLTSSKPRMDADAHANIAGQSSVLDRDLVELKAAASRQGVPVLEFAVTDSKELLIWVVFPDGRDTLCLHVKLGANGQEGSEMSEELDTLLQMTQASMGVTGRNRQLAAVGSEPVQDTFKLDGSSEHDPTLVRDAGHRSHLLQLFVENACSKANSQAPADETEREQEPGLPDAAEKELDDSGMQALEEIYRDPVLLAEMKAGTCCVPKRKIRLRGFESQLLQGAFVWPWSR